MTTDPRPDQPDRPGDARASPARPRLKLSAILSAIASLVVAVTQAFGVSAASLLTLKAVSVMGLALGLFQVVNSSLRPTFEHWQKKVDARPLLVVEAGLGLLWVAAGLYGLDAEEPSAAIMAIAYAPGAVLYWMLEDAILKKVVDAGKHTGTYFVKRFHPFRRLRSDVTLGDSAERTVSTPQGRFFHVVLDEKGELTVSISVTRVWIATFAALALGLTLAAAAGGFAADVIESRSEDAAERERAADTTAKTSKKARERAEKEKPTTPADQGTGGGSEQSGGGDAGERECDLTFPGEHIPASVRRNLYDAFLGGDASGLDDGAPGVDEAGCAGAVHDIDRRFFYTEGTDAAGNLMSVAVDSREWGTAIFLAPATEPVLQLIHELGALGGTDRHDVLNGDVYLVHSKLGTHALVRAQKGPPMQPQSYVTMPPAVSDIWFAAMRNRGAWLWPARLERKLPRGRVGFEFRTSALGKSGVLRVRYDPASGTAAYVAGGRKVVNHAVGHHIADEAVVELGETAR